MVSHFWQPLAVQPAFLVAVRLCLSLASSQWHPEDPMFKILMRQKGQEVTSIPRKTNGCGGATAPSRVFPE
jgi:hypothetical protein